MMKMKAVVVGDTVLLMDLVVVPGYSNTTNPPKQWVEISRVPLGALADKTIEEYEAYLEEKFKVGNSTVHVRIKGDSGSFAESVRKAVQAQLDNPDRENKFNDQIEYQSLVVLVNLGLIDRDKAKAYLELHGKN